MNTEERARKNNAIMLQGLAKVGQTAVATALQVSESTVSRMKETDFERLSKVLAVCDLKIVPQSYRCAKPEMIEAAMVFAKAAIEQIHNNDAFIYDE